MRQSLPLLTPNFQTGMGRSPQPRDLRSTGHRFHSTHPEPVTLWAASIYTHHPEQSPQQLALPGAREGDLGSVNPQARPTAPHITPRKPLAEVGAWPTGSSPGLVAARTWRGWISLNSCNTHSLTPSALPPRLVLGDRSAGSKEERDHPSEPKLCSWQPWDQSLLPGQRCPEAGPAQLCSALRWSPRAVPPNRLLKPALPFSDWPLGGAKGFFICLFVCLGFFLCINKENLQASYLTPLALFYF